MKYVHRTPELGNVLRVQQWILSNHGEYDDAFDCAVGCAASLGIYDFDEKCIGNDYTVPPFIQALTEVFFAGEGWDNTDFWDEDEDMAGFEQLRQKTFG